MVAETTYTALRRLLTDLAQMPEDFLQGHLRRRLSRLYGEKNIISSPDAYLVAKGTTPVALIAHIDTVFSRPPTPEEIFYDQEKKVMWSPSAGLGDDRLGVAAILFIVQALRNSDLPLPTLIFTSGEESCGFGAQTLANDYPTNTFNLKYLIELDRRGNNDCVFYQCENNDFIKYIESYGFKYADGSYTDISFLMDEWAIPAVNLSIGYYEEHSYSEYVRLDETLNTIKKIITMLANERKGLGYGERR